MIRIRPDLRGEEGYAVAIALSVLSIMLVIGLAVLATVDNGSQRTREQRVRESALSLTEGALYSQGAVLARNWPSKLARSYLDCARRPPRRPALPEQGHARRVQLLAASRRCIPEHGLPNGRQLADVGSRQLRRAGDRLRPGQGQLSLTGAEGTCVGPCKWDFNGDHAMWVQARAKVRDRYRNVVALLKLEELQESVAGRAVVSGAVAITNNGNHGGTYMIDGSGSTVSVRCPPEPPGTHNATCTEYEAGQITPPPVNANPADMLTPAQINSFRDRAVIDGTYYANCPPDNLVGQVVFVEKCLTPPNYHGGGGVACTPPTGLKSPCVNTADRPGLLIVHCGALQANANWTYVGVMYFANKTLADGSCTQRGTASARASS